MKRFRLGSNFVVFFLFFGIALPDAFKNQNWLQAGFWIIIGGLFLTADNLKKA